MESSFYLRPPEIVARESIGCILKHILSPTDVRSVRITETEAYLAEGDEACHAHRGFTKRTAPMFEEGGILYVYLIYGLHWCVNIVTEEKGRASAVLLRGGIDAGTHISGPGRLSQYMAIDGLHNTMPIEGDRFSLVADNHTQSWQTRSVTSNRIGINKSVDLPLRFVVNNVADLITAPERLRL